MATHVGILPKDVLDSLLLKLETSNHDRKGGLRFLRLPHPRTGIPSLFLPYEQQTTKRTIILEVQSVAPANERSWFMSEGIVLENGKLLVMTPVDPAFLLIPILQLSVPADGSLGTFRPADDLHEAVVEKLLSSPVYPPDPEDTSTHVCREDIETFFSLPCTDSAMKRVCDVKNITPEITVYRFSMDRVISYLKDKVARLNDAALFETSRTLIRALARDGLMEDGKEELLEAGRLRASCDLVAQYVPQSIREALLASYNFTELNAYMKSLDAEAALLAAAEMDKAEANESRSKASTKGADKKRKGLAKGSTGVEKLKKVNTKGMAKLSTFFQTKAG